MSIRRSLLFFGVPLGCAFALSVINACGDDDSPVAPSNPEASTTQTDGATDDALSAGPLQLAAVIAKPIPRDGTPVEVSLTVKGAAPDEEVSVTLVDPPAGVSVVAPTTLPPGVTRQTLDVRADGTAAVGFATLSIVASTKRSGLTAKASLRAMVLGAAGALDPTWGQDGFVVSIDPASSGQVGLLQNNKLVVGGTAGGHFGLARYDLDVGAIDPAFNGGAIVKTTIGESSEILALASQIDGRVVAVGWSMTGTTRVAAVARYETNGTLDTTFGGGAGFVTFGLGGSGDRARAIAMQSEGQIVVGGETVIGGKALFAIARRTTSGTPDPTFGDGGVVVGPYGSPDAGVAELAVTGSPQRIIVAGTDGNAGAENFRIARYLGSGELDPAFVPLEVDFGGGSDRVGGMSLTPSGALIVGGTVMPGPNFGLTRLTAMGDVESSFGDAGRLVVQGLGAGTNDMESLAVQADGRILLGGTSGNGQPQIARIVPTGGSPGLDPSFAGTGTVRLPGTGYVVSILILRDERILVVLGGSPLRVARVFR